MDLLICAGVFHLPWGCMAIDEQALYLSCMIGSIPSMPQSGLGMYPNLMVLAECGGQEAAHHDVKLCPWTC